MNLLNLSKLALAVFIISLTSCGKYNKLLKSADNEKKYAAAIDYYNKGKYAKATPLFETLSVPYNGTSRADTVSFYEAKGYYMTGDKYSAESYLAQFCRVYGRSKFVEEAYFLRAKNLYSMALRPDLDQTSTIEAIGAISEFKTRYPNSEFGLNDKDMERDLKGRLEEKSYLSAKLYYQIEDYKAAVIALSNSVKDYPDSKFKEELMFLTFKSSYLFAKKSVKRKQADRYIAAIDEYYNFLSEYPGSKYSKEAENMYNESLSYTNKHGIEINKENN